jgi:hypothetical protein
MVKSGTPPWSVFDGDVLAIASLLQTSRRPCAVPLVLRPGFYRNLSIPCGA